MGSSGDDDQIDYMSDTSIGDGKPKADDDSCESDLSLIDDSDDDSKDGDRGENAGYHGDIKTIRYTIPDGDHEGKVVYKTENDKDPKVYNKHGAWIGNLIGNKFEEADVVLAKFNMKKSSAQGGKRKTRKRKRKRIKKKRKRKHTKKKRKRKRRKTRK